MRNSSSAETSLSAFIDKDPIYRTHDIYCRVYDMKVTLRPSKTRSETNCRGFMFVNFNQKGFPEIKHEENELEGVKYYQLSCGHVHRSKKGSSHDVGKTIPCMACGGKMAYWSHAHEWSHIIFRSNPFLYRAFAKKYQEKLKAEGYDIGSDELGSFLHLFINAFDDIRVNSLEEHVYPGAAHEIWMKWKKLCERDENLNEDFISFVFGVALGAENLDHQNGPYAELIPEIKEATDKIRLKGPANMLSVVRWALDRCVKKLLQPSPPQQGDQGDQQQTGGGTGDQRDQSSTGDSDQGPTGAPDQATDPAGARGQGLPGGDQEEDRGGPGGDPSAGPSSQGDQSGLPDSSGNDSSSSNNGDDQQTLTPGNALRLLAKNANVFQEDEGHHKPDLAESDPASQATTAAVHKALSMNIDDDVDDAIQVGQIDQDVQDAVNKLQNVSNPTNASNFILTQAKANLLLVDVRPEDIQQESTIEISSSDRRAIDRMRAAFARVMGQESYKMDTSGSDIDISSVIQFLMDPTDDDVFSMETVQKGFAYRILGDMSGSMSGEPFDTVCRAHEMLKRALDYPFVFGDFWGFRGAEIAHARNRRYSSADSHNMAQLLTNNGEIWLYRYDSKCTGYHGRSRGVNISGKASIVPVKCGGLTPMHSALHVAIKDLLTQVAAGMAKRMFLLTDGYPTQFTTQGKDLSRSFLQGLVAKEIRNARQKGTQVYTFVIGHHISDDDALEMFGPRRFWRRVDADVSIGQALVEVVLSEFVKYLKSK